jgi:hypothetical protein
MLSLSSNRRFRVIEGCITAQSGKTEIGKFGFVQQVVSLEVKAHETCSLFVT